MRNYFIGSRAECRRAFTMAWQWIVIVMAYPFCSYLATFVDQNSLYVKLLYGVGSLFLMWAGPAYFVKFFRYEANIWKGQGMIWRDMDSGQKQCARIYLGRRRPHVLFAPLSHFALKWTFKVGEIDLQTGSVSHYDVFVTNLVEQEKQCRSIGTNDVLSGSAASHVKEIMDSVSLSYRVERLVIEKLVESGLKIDDPEKQED